MLTVLVVAIALLIFHCVFNNRYGYFRDEFNYMASGDHLAWGYVDQPPLLPFLVRISRSILGDSLRSIRFVPALAISALVVLTGFIAREFGGCRFALLLSAIAIVIAPIFLSDGSLVTTNCLEPLLWMGCVYCAILALKRDARYWLAFGVVAGLGLEEKYSIAFFCFSIVIGLLLTKHRRTLLNRWFWLGGLLAFLVFLPNLIWNIQHDWPFLELMRNVRVTGKDVVLPPGRYLLQQVMMMNPVSFPFWFGGLLFYFCSRAAKNYRLFGYTFVLTIAAFMITHGKDYYSAPAYVLLFPAGAVATEALLRMRPRLQLVLQPACFVWLLLGVVPLLPLVLPVLPIETFVRYQSHLPFELPKTERSFIGESLPQYYADEFPWPGMVAAVAGVYHSLTPEEQQRVAIFGSNYGQAGAIDFFGPQYGLPKAISGHQNYFLWGPRHYTGDIVILLGGLESEARQQFESVTVAATLQNPYAYRYENRPILVCRGLKWDLQKDWARVKNWR